MQDLTKCPNKLDKKKLELKVIIETPKHRRNKFDYDPDFNLFCLGGLLPEGMAFPYDFGFIPSTLGEDGDPLDVMVLMDEPAAVGLMLDVRIIGVIEAEQTQEGKTETNDRFIAVSVHSYSHENIANVDKLPDSLMEGVEQFFTSYNKLRGKKFRVKGIGGPKRALALLEKGIEAADKQNAAAKKEAAGKK